jgi:hypothetical protein
MVDESPLKIEWVLACRSNSPLEQIEGDFFFYNSDSGDTHILSSFAGKVVHKLKQGSQSELFLYELIKGVHSDLSYDSFRRMLNSLAAREIIEIAPK